MGLTIRLPDGDSVFISKLHPNFRGDKVRLGVTVSGRKQEKSRQCVVGMSLDDARQLARSILSITDPEEEPDEAET